MNPKAIPSGEIINGSNLLRKNVFWFVDLT